MGGRLEEGIRKWEKEERREGEREGEGWVMNEERKGRRGERGIGEGRDGDHEGGKRNKEGDDGKMRI